MHTELKALLYKAEDHYLSKSEIDTFLIEVQSLEARLQTYEFLRDREIEIFQPVADQLIQRFPGEDEAVLERSLKQWLGVMRYSAIAMLLNDSTFLQHRLLEWLTPIITARQTQPIEQELARILTNQLEKDLSEAQMILLQPFLTQSKATLLKKEAVVQ